MCVYYPHKHTFRLALRHRLVRYQARERMLLLAFSKRYYKGLSISLPSAHFCTLHQCDQPSSTPVRAIPFAPDSRQLTRGQSRSQNYA